MSRLLCTGIIAIALAASVGAWRPDAATFVADVAPRHLCGDDKGNLVDCNGAYCPIDICTTNPSVFAQDIPHAGIADPLAPRDVKLTLGQVREVQMALATIETHDGKAVPTCLGDIKPPCLPLAIASAIADDLSALSPHWVFYQGQAHRLIGDASGGSGYLAPGSREETIANFRLFDLNSQPVTVKIRPLDLNGLESSGVQIAPTVKAILAPIVR